MREGFWVLWPVLSGHSLVLLLFLILSPSCLAKFPKTAHSTLLSQAEEDWSSTLSYEKLFGSGFGFLVYFPPLLQYFLQQNSFPCWLGFSFSLNCSQNFLLLLCWGYSFMLEIWWEFQVWGFLSECLWLCNVWSPPSAAAVVHDISLAGELIHCNKKHTGHTKAGFFFFFCIWISSLRYFTALPYKTT